MRSTQQSIESGLEVFGHLNLTKNKMTKERESMKDRI